MKELLLVAALGNDMGSYVADCVTGLNRDFRQLGVKSVDQAPLTDFCICGYQKICVEKIGGRDINDLLEKGMAACGHHLDRLMY